MPRRLTSWANSLAALATFAVAVEVSSPGVGWLALAFITFGAAMPAMLVLTVAYLYWCWYSMSGKSIIRSSADSCRRRSRWAWAPIPICALALAAIPATDWPLRLRFAFGRPALEAAAAALNHGSTAPESFARRRVGTFYVYAASDAGDGGARFITGDSIIDPVGFQYYPAGVPAARWRYGPFLDAHWAVEEW